ncbi:Spx/MgsR family RNA polymerase-binding regulatory protein [Sphingobacterium hungaricum]|uniref:Arsenate reductase n=1 Tax=Sphingobacterium hungaricum TaxID=2082723 RepID=A0A928UZY0_9SPHI|nr:Spx/MgsR family RNA polymerase-binding regulatory protein [Sphingobacterium hungaricum]MBE8715188.1 arsenate reductase [Sphingobacterium hungaricum]
MIQVYGIKNCSTVKKALNWLEDKKLDYQFHDYKKEPATLTKLQEWEKSVSWEVLVNKKGTTWRKFSKDEQAAVTDAKTANEALLANNSLIKRPVLEIDKQLIVGFNEEEYLQKLT